MKKFLLLALLVVLAMPCLLLFTEGVDGSFTVWNVVGLVYTTLLIVGCRWVLPKSLINKIEKMVED